MLFAFCDKVEPDQSSITIVIPDSEQEGNYIWQNIQDIGFFDKNGYSVLFPGTNLFKDLLSKARNNFLVDSDLGLMQKHLSDSVYKKSDYQAGYKKVSGAMPKINFALSTISENIKNWEFKYFDEYKITLTLYGPGGSYDPETGRIILQSTPSGDFKNYKNPENTIIHEMIHMGIETSIISKYGLSHQIKERIVDKFVQVWFGDMLPDYRLQNFGDTRIDKYLETKSDFLELPKQIEQFLTEN